MYLILGKSSFVREIKGYDLSSFNLELYLGLCLRINCLSSISASLGDCVTMYSISSDSETSFGIIFLSGLEEKYERTLVCKLVALPTYIIRPSFLRKRYTPDLLGRFNLACSTGMFDDAP